MNHLYLSRRNLLTLLSKLDRVKAGESSACTLIKRDYLHKKYPQSPEEITITAIEDDDNQPMVITAIEDEDYYSDREPGEVHPFDIVSHPFSKQMREELKKQAWELYCKETGGGMDVKDFWEELSRPVQLIYINKVNDELREY